MPVEDSESGAYIDWAAILAGGVFALALSFLLISFGAGLGLSLTSPYRGEGVSAAWLAIAAGIWFVWTMVTSFGAGGYLAGRMRRRIGDATPDEVETRDGVHGLMVWATGALVSTLLVASGVGGLLSAGSSAAGTVADVAAEAVPTDYFANVMLRSAADAPGAEPTDAAEADPAPQATQRPAQEIPALAGVDPAVQLEIASILGRSIASGEMVERDRDYLARLVAANSDLDTEAARTRVDEVNEEIASARMSAMEAVDDARRAGVVFGFITAATLLIGALAAFFGASTGGRHRDAGLGFDALSAGR
ncbi:MAG: hypothetical protein JJT81_14835 [Rubellimicrobium sp.]|nr:hypothetical protein [Rubellimicrobium sp.]